MINIGRKLELKKTHDFSVSDKPKLTVVFIHGIASNSASFTNALKYLEGTKSLNDVRFVTFDLLGSGKSLKSDELTYGYTDQLTALENSIKKLKIKTPLILVGHSMGTFIVERYADKHRRDISKLILVSPPVYTKRDLDNPAFDVAMRAFCDAVSVKDPSIVKEKSFKNSIEKIVKNRNNYDVLTSLTLPIVIIFGELDKIIAPYNFPRLLKNNSNISAIRTAGKHSVSRDKYIKIKDILEKEVNAEAL